MRPKGGSGVSKQFTKYPAIRPKLAFSKDNWMLTFIKLNENEANREIRFYAPTGEFTLRLSRAGDSKTMISVRLTFHNRTKAKKSAKGAVGG